MDYMLQQRGYSFLGRFILFPIFFPKLDLIWKAKFGYPNSSDNIVPKYFEGDTAYAQLYVWSQVAEHEVVESPGQP